MSEVDKPTPQLSSNELLTTAIAEIERRMRIVCGAPTIKLEDDQWRALLTVARNAVETTEPLQLLKEARTFIQHDKRCWGASHEDDCTCGYVEFAKKLAFLDSVPTSGQKAEPLPESLRDPQVVMDRVRALQVQTDAALWLLRWLNNRGGLGFEKHGLIDAVLEGRAYVRGDQLYTDGPTPPPTSGQNGSLPQGKT